MINVEWMVEPLESPDYYRAKLRELDQRWKKFASKDPIDMRTNEQARQELKHLASLATDRVVTAQLEGYTATRVSHG